MMTIDQLPDRPQKTLLNDPKETANKVLNMVTDPYSGNISVPTDVYAIADKMGITVNTMDTIKSKDREIIYGFCLRKDGVFRTYINAQYKDMMHYALAQCLGLSLILNNDGKDEGFIINDKNANNEKHQWAKMFAEVLLMPAKSVRVSWANADSIDTISATYHVPIDVVYQRLASLKLHE
jgi:Zn-dependent peptidase ImmA (M78 family)